MNGKKSAIMECKSDHKPERTCIVTRQTRPRAELLRFVRAPDGTVVFDLKGSLPGRGAWLVPEREVLEEAVQRNAFARAFRARTKVSPDLPQQVAQQLREAALTTLSLARRAGEAVAGFEKVRELLRKGEAGVLIAAVDGARDGREKLLRLAHAVKPDMPVVGIFDSTQLGLAFGRERVIHAAMKPGGLARKFLHLAGKLRTVADTAAPVRARGRKRETEQGGR